MSHPVRSIHADVSTPTRNLTRCCRGRNLLVSLPARSGAAETPECEMSCRRGLLLSTLPGVLRRKSQTAPLPLIRPRSASTGDCWFWCGRVTISAPSLAARLPPPDTGTAAPGVPARARRQVSTVRTQELRLSPNSRPGRGELARNHGADWKLRAIFGNWSERQHQLLELAPQLGEVLAPSLAPRKKRREVIDREPPRPQPKQYQPRPGSR
jgi:hypothetical protein